MAENHASNIQTYHTYIKASAQALWDALTQPQFTVRYGYAPVVDYGGRVGAHYKAYPNEGMKRMPGIPAVICDGEILEWQPPFKLVHTFRMLMEPSLAADGFTRVSYDIKPVRGGVTKLTIRHDLTGTRHLAALVGGDYEARGAGGGWNEIVAGLKTLLETGEPLPCQSGPPDAGSCAA